jgi:hypothetical protein
LLAPPWLIFSSFDMAFKYYMQLSSGLAHIQ